MPPPSVSPAASSAALSILLALLGYVTTALHTLRAQQHRYRVERVGEQLKELYGPLLACVTASKSSYDAMIRQSTVGGGAAPTPAEFRKAARADPSGPAATQYRLWVRDVLMPLSERAARLVVERADLLEGSSIEPLLLQLVAHVSAYKVILRRWAEGSCEDEHSAIAYPDAIHEWVSDHFDRLKKRQAALLGITAEGGQGSPLMRMMTARL